MQWPVREASPGSHANKGWEQFTDAAIAALNDKPTRVVFLLWGTYARKKASKAIQAVIVFASASGQ